MYERSSRRLRTKGVMLWLEGDLLRYRAPPGSLSSEDMETLKRHKADVLEILRAEGPAPERKPSNPVAAPNELLPLTFAQEAFVNYYPALADPRIQHCTVVLSAPCRTDPVLLERALRAIEARHPVLRTRYVPNSEGRQQSLLDPAIEAELVVAPEGIGADGDRATAAFVEEVCARRFSLEKEDRSFALGSPT